MHGPGDVRLFDLLAPAYDRLAPAARSAPLRRAVAHADGRVERVLDVAGGPGRGARALDPLDPVVVDAAAGMCRRARTRGVTAVRGDAAGLPVADGAADAVLVVDALHHLPDRRGALAEAGRVLRPGGVLVVREFDPGTLRGRALVAGERLAGMGSRFCRPDALAAMVGDAGLDARVLDRGFAYTVLGRKRESH